MLSDEFLDTARRLARGVTEGDWRSAVSRAYYSVFHRVRDLCLAHGLDLGQGGQAHSNLYIGLNNCGVPRIQTLAGQIDRLRGFRAIADYESTAHHTQQFAADMVDDATVILSDLQAIVATTPAAQIVAGAKHLQLIGRIP